MADALVTQLARALNLSPDAARHTLNHLVAALREQIDATGEASVPGLGTFRHGDDGLDFAPDAALARAVNHRYAGLRAISASRRRPEPAAPTNESDDPFAAVSPTAPDDESPPAAEFQPLDTFIEPDASESTDDAALEVAEEETEETDSAFEAEEIHAEEAVPEATDSEPATSESPTLDYATSPSDELTDEAPDPIDDASVVEDEPTFGDEPVEEDEPLAEEEALLVDEEESIADEAFADDTLESNEDEKDLLDSPEEANTEAEDAFADLDAEVDDEVESVGEIEAAEDAGLPDWDTDAPEVETDEDPSVIDEAAEPDDRDLSRDEDQDDRAWLQDVAATSAPPDEPEAPPAPPPVTKPQTPGLAPAVAATASAPASEPPPRRSRMPVLGGLAALLLVVVAVLWFVNREPAAPPVAEQPPVTQDTVAAALPPPVDSTATLPTDTASGAVATPDPPPPAPSADPLRGSAGIDRADGGFSWIVGSEFSRAPAERRVAEFREQGFRADVIAEEANGRTRYRVALGQFTSIEEADRFRSALPAGVPPDTWLLRL